jgi:hypothetical protein
MDTTDGQFYRTAKGHVVKVMEHSGLHKVCVGYRGVYGLGWRTTWIPAETQLTPAPDVVDFPEATPKDPGAPADDAS